MRIEPVPPKPPWEVVSNRFGLITHAHPHFYVTFKGDALAKKSYFFIFLFIFYSDEVKVNRKLMLEIVVMNNE